MSSILVLNFFPAFNPPRSGGEMRFLGLYTALSQFHDITLLTSTDFNARREEIRHTNRLTEIRFPKDDLWTIAYQTLEKSGVSGDLSGMAFSLAVSEPTCSLRNVARQIAPSMDLIIHEFPFSEPIFGEGAPVPEIYNSHNFELGLLSSIIRGPGFDRVALKLARLEQNLARRAKTIYATSVDDGKKFELFYNIKNDKIKICPNGFDESEFKTIHNLPFEFSISSNPRPKLTFIASSHFPNVEAAQFLVGIAPALGKYDIVFAGSVCSHFKQNIIPQNVYLCGILTPSEKLELLKTTSVLLNPVILGSGTSLKAVEALATGIPMISTAEGSRGLGLVSGKHAIITSRDNFINAVDEIFSDAEFARQIAKQGQTKAFKSFSWRAIAKELNDTLFDDFVGDIHETRRIVALNDYSVKGLKSGGAARIRGLLSSLEHNIILMTFGASLEIILLDQTILHITVPKGMSHLAYEELLRHNQPASADDIAASLFVSSNQLFVELFANLLQDAAAVVFEHPYMAPLLATIKAHDPNISIIYSSHNVESSHKRAILEKHTASRILTEYVHELECRLIAEASVIICCTEADRIIFSAGAKNCIVIANGCAVPEWPTKPRDNAQPSLDRKVRIGFIGSAHGPNVDAANFIIRDIASVMADCIFEFIGSVCSSIIVPEKLQNIVLHGVVTDDVKSKIMFDWALALNPLESGGGSSLKLSDYMAHGLASISTPTGARGFPIEEEAAGVVVPLEQFLEAVGTLLANPNTKSAMGEKAKVFSHQKLTWDGCAAEYRKIIAELVNRPARQIEKRALLVVTYRYTEPALGGAEEYLVEVLKKIRPRFNRIDLASVNTDEITNKFHFATSFKMVPGGAAARLGELFDKSSFFDADVIAEDLCQAVCRDLERFWTRTERELLSSFAEEIFRPGDISLLSGFYGPENHGTIVRRWTSPQFSVIIPSSTKFITISGYASCNKTLNATFYQSNPNGDFSEVGRVQINIGAHFKVTLHNSIEVSVPFLIVVFALEEHEAPGDHRPLGLLLEHLEIAYLNDDVNVVDKIVRSLRHATADLTLPYDKEVSSRFFPQWMEVLRSSAMHNSKRVEQDFSLARGPRSQAMLRWIDECAKNYDCVLVQGIPFDTIPSVVETLSQKNQHPRIVTLPHFHADDRFYYWKRYLDSFSKADSNLIFSPSVANQLSQHGKMSVVPGGGIKVDEQAERQCIEAFKAIHSKETPFFLVLGRKTGSKGYRRVVDAIRLIRRAGVDVDLVLIGPDEDGVPVGGEGVFYLGRQPREVVKGALTSAVGLVTMSASESFGIVLCEAWLFYKPVIANRECYSFRDLVRDGETGILVGSNAELENSIIYLLNNPEVCNDMGKAGFQNAIEYYSWDKVADAIFHQLIPTE